MTYSAGEKEAAAEASRRRESHGETGLVHIYCGDGKGKTTAAMGLCLRAAGAGKKVLICQFMKDGSSNERRILEHTENISLMPVPARVSFSFRMSPTEREQAAAACRDLFRRAALSAAQDTDVLLLDEVLYAVRSGFLDEAELVRFLKSRPQGLEIILTGRDPGEEVISLADYVSEIRKVKHPFEAGLPAREGIER